MQENKNRRIFSVSGHHVFLHRGARRGFFIAAVAYRCTAFALLCLLTSRNSAPAADTIAAPPAAGQNTHDGEAPEPKPSSPVAEVGTKKQLEALLSKNRYPLQKVFVALKDLDQDGDSMIAQCNADSLVNPASVSKLLTAAIAFDRLGTRYAFTTSVYQDSAFDPAAGACKGLVYIRGGGDPSLVIERLWLFVQHLVCMGVTSIEKDIVLDDSFFDTVSCGPGFYEESADNPYMAPVNALSVNFNCVSVWVRPGASPGAPVFSSLLPKSEIVGLSSFAKTAPGGKQTDCIISVKKAQDMTSVTVSGTLPKDNKQVLEYRKVWQTRDYFASVLRTLLKDNRIAFKGNFRHGTVPESLRQKPPFYAFASPPLSDIVTDMFKFSSNFAAEMIFKTLSAEKDPAFGGTWEKSAALATQWWKEKGLNGTGASAPKIKNGSGMGNSNRMSCRQIVGLLSYVNMSKSFLPEYLYALPSAGVDGTLKSRFKNSRFKGIVRGKTGTLNDFGVHSIAGYVLFPEKSYAFAIIFNGLTNHSQVNQWEMQEKILDLIVPEK